MADQQPEVEIIDPAVCPFRDTCPALMQCVTEYLMEMTRKDWGVDTLQQGDEDDTI